MKLLRIVLLFALMLAVGCGDDNRVIPTLEVRCADGEKLSGATLTFAAEASEQMFCIESNGSWQVKCEAEWLTVTPSSGSGNGAVRLSVSTATASRSAVVSVMSTASSQLYHTFDVVQWVTSPDNPTNAPNEPNNPDNPPGDDPGVGGGNGDKPSDDNDDPAPNPNPNPNPNPETPIYGDYGKAINLAAIHAGRYYVGGMRDENLYLALGEISAVGHCRTAQFGFNQDGVPVGQNGVSAAVVELSEADCGFHLYFEDCGYLKATADRAGALIFTEQPDASWQFAVCDGGGYHIRQVGDINAQLIFSQRAESDLLRSIGGDEEGGYVRLFLLKE